MLVCGTSLVTVDLTSGVLSVDSTFNTWMFGLITGGLIDIVLFFLIFKIFRLCFLLILLFLLDGGIYPPFFVRFFMRRCFILGWLLVYFVSLDFHHIGLLGFHHVVFGLFFPSSCHCCPVSGRVSC